MKHSTYAPNMTKRASGGASVLHQNIALLEETLLSGRKLNRDVARSLVGCAVPASAAACSAAGLPAGSSWGEVAKSALVSKRTVSGP